MDRLGGIKVHYGHILPPMSVYKLRVNINKYAVSCNSAQFRLRGWNIIEDDESLQNSSRHMMNETGDGAGVIM